MGSVADFRTVLRDFFVPVRNLENGWTIACLFFITEDAASRCLDENVTGSLGIKSLVFEGKGPKHPSVGDLNR
jgi:hypothetical protein